MKKKTEEKKNTGKIVAFVAVAAVLLAAVILLAVRCSAAPDEEPEETPTIDDVVDTEETAKDKDQGKDKSKETPAVKPDKTDKKPKESPKVEDKKENNAEAATPSVPSGNGSSSGNSGSSGNNVAPEKPSVPDNGGSEAEKEHEEHVHNWQAVYTTIKHEEKGHMETVTVTPAWDEEEYAEVTVCSVCGYVGADVPFHVMDAHDGNGGYYSEPRPTGNVIHHEAVTEERWIVDSPAYEEQVIDHYYCTCGETKKG